MHKFSIGVIGEYKDLTWGCTVNQVKVRHAERLKNEQTVYGGAVSLIQARHRGRTSRRIVKKKQAEMATKAELMEIFGADATHAATQVQAAARRKAAKRVATKRKQDKALQGTQAAALLEEQEEIRKAETFFRPESKPKVDYTQWTQQTLTWRHWCHSNDKAIVSPRPEREGKRFPDQELIEVKLLKAKFKVLVCGRQLEQGNPTEQLLAIFDPEGQGIKINIDAFVAGVRRCWKVGGEAGVVTPSQAKKLFAMIDVDGSGDIDVDELVTFVWGKAFTSKGAMEATSKEEANARAKADALIAEYEEIASVGPEHDGDAPSNEDLALIKERMQALSYDASTGVRQDPQRVFQTFDIDNSGELSMAEFIAAVRVLANARRRVV
jgi:Ca2+-binding EF-hand superfamily protein